MAHLIALLTILVFVSAAHSIPSCPDVIQHLSPCLLFVKGATQDPSLPCCSGANDLNNNVHTSQDKVAVCTCLKQTLANIGNYEPSTLSLLPKKCGLNLDLPPIDKQTDCSRFALGY